MEVKEEVIRRITISNVPNLDSIRVMLEDIGPGQGRINIECFGESWAAYWGGMGGDTITQFFIGCDEHYLAEKLSNISPQVYDPSGLKNSLKTELLGERRKRRVSGGYARQRFNSIESLELPETEEQLWSISRELEELIGEEWWYRIPKTPNPDYLYLTRIIKTVQAALMMETDQPIERKP